MTTPALEYDVQTIASRVLYELLGRRWVWPRLRVEDVHRIAPDIFLAGRPVHEIISIVGPSGVVTPDNYELSGNHRLRLAQAYVRQYMGSGWTPSGGYGTPESVGCSGPAEVTVTYVYGSRPPEQVRYAIDVLAAELEKAMTGDSSCKLPKRVTSITRQGVSMTLLDPQDFLENGKTGVTEVDFAISVFNRGRAKARARIFTDKTPPPRRLSTVLVEEDLEPEGSNFTIKQGQDWSATWPVYQSDGTTPQDLTGWTIKAQVRPYPGSSTLLHEWSADEGNIQTALGELELEVPAATSAAWTWRRGRYDIEITSPGGVVTRVDAGTIYVDPELTV